MGGLGGEKKPTAPHHPLPPASKKKYQADPAQKNKENTKQNPVTRTNIPGNKQGKPAASGQQDK